MFSVVEHYRGRDYRPRLIIGDGTQIGQGIWFSCVGEIEIGENNLLGHNILIADSSDDFIAPDEDEKPKGSRDQKICAVP